VGVRRGERAQISELQLTESPDAPHDAPPREKANVRVEWACNQRCQFCWVDFGWTPPSREQVLEDLALLRARGHDRLSITGGEPTLVPWLEDVVSTAASLGFSTVELQTNAVLLARAGRAEALARAGLTDALVSLHASSAEISDAITQKPGTFEQTVVGADALARAGVRLHISHVLTSANLCETERFVDFVVQRWGKATQVVWAVAHPITRASSRTSGAIPSFDAVRPALLQGLERSLTTGLAFGNINEACGVPPCVLGHDPRFVAPVSPELAKHEAFTHLPICATCEAKPRCRGVRKGYAELHGEAGLVPLHHGTARPHMGG
jgi:cyclic pyranopterin phosphate synthase